MPFGTSNTMNSSSSRGTPAEDGKVPRSSLAQINASDMRVLLSVTHQGHLGALQLISSPLACVVQSVHLGGEPHATRPSTDKASFQHQEF